MWQGKDIYILAPKPPKQNYTHSTAKVARPFRLLETRDSVRHTTTIRTMVSTGPSNGWSATYQSAPHRERDYHPSHTSSSSHSSHGAPVLDLLSSLAHPMIHPARLPSASPPSNSALRTSDIHRQVFDTSPVPDYETLPPDYAQMFGDREFEYANRVGQ